MCAFSNKYWVIKFILNSNFLIKFLRVCEIILQLDPYLCSNNFIGLKASDDHAMDICFGEQWSAKPVGEMTHGTTWGKGNVLRGELTWRFTHPHCKILIFERQLFERINIGGNIGKKRVRCKGDKGSNGSKIGQTTEWTDGKHQKLVKQRSVGG